MVGWERGNLLMGQESSFFAFQGHTYTGLSTTGTHPFVQDAATWWRLTTLSNEKLILLTLKGNNSIVFTPPIGQTSPAPSLHQEYHSWD
jgi:hypothetical protein